MLISISIGICQPELKASVAWSSTVLCSFCHLRMRAAPVAKPWATGLERGRGEQPGRVRRGWLCHLRSDCQISLEFGPSLMFIAGECGLLERIASVPAQPCLVSVQSQTAGSNTFPLQKSYVLRSLKSVAQAWMWMRRTSSWRLRRELLLSLTCISLFILWFSVSTKITLWRKSLQTKAHISNGWDEPRVH